MFNWLHFTDLHWGLAGQRERISNIRKCLFEDLRELACQAGPWNCVLFTGDLVQRGSRTEFDSLDEEFFKPLSHELVRHGAESPLFFAVPGNHDIDRNAVSGFDVMNRADMACSLVLKPDQLNPLKVDSTIQPLFTRELYETDFGCAILAAFKNYANWWNRKKPKIGGSNGPITVEEFVDGHLPGDFSASLKISYPRNVNSPATEYSVGIVGLNTTFLQLASGDYRGKLAIHPLQLHKVLKGDVQSWCMKHEATLLLTHQGPEWLTDHALAELRHEINPPGRFTLHLYGHEHVMNVQSRSYFGGPTQNSWQGSSLFSMEPIESRPEITERRHGYALGRLDREAGCLRMWPRKIVRSGSQGWSAFADTDEFRDRDAADDSVRLPLAPVNAISWHAIYLSHAQDDLKREKRRLYADEHVVIRHLGLDMKRAKGKLEDVLGDCPRKSVTFELLMLAPSDHDAWKSRVIGEHLKTWLDNAKESKDEVRATLASTQSQWESRDCRFTPTVKLYAEVPAIHGFSLGVQVEEKFVPKVTWFSYCRWHPEASSNNWVLDWQENRYWKIVHDRLDPLASDMYAIFDGAFHHLWNAATTTELRLTER